MSGSFDFDADDVDDEAGPSVGPVDTSVGGGRAAAATETLWVSVWDWDKHSSPAFMGQVSFDISSLPEGLHRRQTRGFLLGAAVALDVGVAC